MEENKKQTTDDDEEDEKRRTRSNSVLTQTEVSIGNISQEPLTTRHLELLVHNVSHMDLVLSLGTTPTTTTTCNNGGHDRNSSVTEEQHTLSNDTLYNNNEEEEATTEILCRPHFSTFYTFTKRILTILQKTKFGTATRDDSTRQSTSYPHSSCDIMCYPRYERSDCLPRCPLIVPHPSRQGMVPVGLKLSDGSIRDDDDDDVDVEKEGTKSSRNSSHSLRLDAEDIDSLRIRGRDRAKFESLVSKRSMEPAPNTSPTTTANKTSKLATITPNKIHLEAVLFPLLSSLVRQWQSQLVDKYGRGSCSSTSINSSSGKSRRRLKKVIILVSGVGTPRNLSHSKRGNSTEACAELMELFISVLYPDITIIRLHSEREIFQYEENIHFSKKEFMPCIDAYRDAHARGEPYPDEYLQNSKWGSNYSNHPQTTMNRFDPDWKQTFSVTLSFADGAPARTHAIQTSLRAYKPSTMHFYELKTFWYETKICDDDVVHLSFEDMETVPAMEVGKTSSSVQMVVKEMKIFRQHFLKAMEEGRNDIDSFWLRKSKKPVLAVLLVDLPQEGGLMVYRGMNMEVSMPTGSLCAERNVIGTALASNPGLLREHLKMVAVLAVPLQSEKTTISSSPFVSSPPPSVDLDLCKNVGIEERQVDREADCFFSKVELKLSQYQQSVTSSSRGIRCNDSDLSDKSISSVVISDEILRSVSSPDLKIISHLPATKYGHVLPSTMINGTPVRKIKLHDYGDSGGKEANAVKANKFHRKKKRTVLVQEQDMNPLKPCGSCNEWLKKIAESNPYFKVITFTDTYCNGVYVMPCQG